jgi:hypothetical protein
MNFAWATAKSASTLLPPSCRPSLCLWLPTVVSFTVSLQLVLELVVVVVVALDVRLAQAA